MKRLKPLLIFSIVALHGGYCFGESASETIQSIAPRPSYAQPIASASSELLEVIARRPDLATFALIGAVTLAGIALLRRTTDRAA